MTEKVDAETLRGKTPGELNEFITDMQKELTGATTPQRGTAPDPDPDESVGTIKRNIARAKTVLNEKLDGEIK